MTADRILLGVAVLGLAAIAVWWVWALNRDTNRRIDQLAALVRQHGGSIVHLHTVVDGTPLQVHQPMNDKIWSGSMASLGRPVAKVTATISGDGSLQAHSTYNGQRCAPDADDTLRLERPPSLARIDERCRAAGLMTVPREALARIAAIEQHLAGGRTATRMELATVLGVQPWEVTADLHTAVLARIVTTTTSHTAGEATYVLADPTIRMDRMSVLPGVN